MFDRARPDSYPTEERYGILSAFLSDLPEAERPTDMEISEYGHQGWHAHMSGIYHDGDFRRHLDDSLALANNENSRDRGRRCGRVA